MNNEEIAALIRPLPNPVSTFDYEWINLEKVFDLFSGVDLNPDFQRGHVWSKDQQRAYIENAMRRNLSPQAITLTFNAPDWHDEPSGDLPANAVCLDGLQRITAVQRFMAGDVKPFGLSHADLAGSKYDPYRPNRLFYTFKIAVFSFQYRAEVLDYYLDLNGAGTPHSAEELARVRALRQSADSMR